MAMKRLYTRNRIKLLNKKEAGAHYSRSLHVDLAIGSVKTEQIGLIFILKIDIGLVFQVSKNN